MKLSAKEKDYRPAIVLDDVHNRTFKNVSATFLDRNVIIYVRDNFSKIRKLFLSINFYYQ